MTLTHANGLTDFYLQIQQQANLRTPAHARRWSTAVLRTLGLNLGRRAKKRLARALPPEMATEMNRAFWLLHFPNPQLSSQEFLRQVGRRSGHSDADFARFPTVAIFSNIKRLIDAETSEEVAKSLSPEVRELWQQA